MKKFMIILRANSSNIKNKLSKQIVTRFFYEINLDKLQSRNDFLIRRIGNRLKLETHQ